MSSLSVHEASARAPVLGTGLLRATLVGVWVAGIALRLYLSRAPLWNDEIWSLLNLRGIGGLPGILWGLSHDNNHFLNSIWLWLVSQLTVDPTALRLVSVLAGALTIPVMAALGARHGAAAGLAAAALTAFSLFQVVYSVEARGYAFATLALVLVYSEIEAQGGSRLRIALACGLGFFAHLAFGPALAGLAFAVFLERLRKGRPLRVALAATFQKFWPAALACLPTLGFLVAGYLNKGGFTIGALTPFSYAHAIAGVASLEMSTFGLDPTSFPQTAFALIGLPLMALAAIALLAPPERRAVYLVMIVLPPALALAFRIPNTHVGRYFFAASPFLILLAADSFGALYARGGVARVAAIAALTAALVSDGAALARMARGESSSWVAALELVARSDSHILASSDDFNVGKSVAWFNATRGAGLNLTPPEQFCEAKSDWYVLETRGNGHAEATLSLCAASYRLEGLFDRDVPAQLPWALYRRAN